MQNELHFCNGDQVLQPLWQTRVSYKPTAMRYSIYAKPQHPVKPATETESTIGRNTSVQLFHMLSENIANSRGDRLAR